MKIRTLFFLVSLSFSLTSCTLGNYLNPVYMIQPLLDNHLTPASPPDPDAPSGIEPANQYSGIPGPIEINKYILPGETKPAVEIIEDDLKKGGASSLADATTERNKLKSSLVSRSNLICSYTEAQMQGNSDISNFSFAELSAGAGGLGAIFTQATAARIFSGVAGLSSATQTNINQTFFKNALTAAIAQKIDSTRSAELTIINDNNKASISDYSLDDMLSDVLSYHDQCSFYAGVEAIVQSSSNSTASTATSPSGSGTSGINKTATTTSGNTTNADAVPSPNVSTNK